MQFKRHSRRLNEGSLEQRVLKAISNVPQHEIQDYDFVSGIFNFVDSLYVSVYEDVWESLEGVDVEDAFRIGVNSGKLAPSDSREPVVYCDEIVFGMKNRAWTGKVLAKLLKDTGFDIYDEDLALEFIERYE